MKQHACLVLALSAAALAVAGSAAAAKTPLPGIVSPSGNIRCLFVPGRPSLLLCSIRHADYARQLQDRCMNPNGQVGAGVDWHGFELHPGQKGRITCTGGILYNPDRQRPAYVTLAYGKTWRHAAYACTSRTTGITCTTTGDHGLFVSRQSWRVW